MSDNLSIAFSLPSAAERRSHGGNHVGPCGQVRVLERRAEGDGCERGSDPPDRPVELVERSLLNLCGDLGAEASVRDRLVGDDEPVRPCDRLEDRVEVEWDERRGSITDSMPSARAPRRRRDSETRRESATT
jgi:hypothetical protein